MPVIVSRRAEADLQGIAAYTLRTWGAEQCGRYLDLFESCFERLAENSASGRPCDGLARGCRRIEVGKHVVFFRSVPGGVRVLRVLHQRMLPDRHLGDGSGSDPHDAS